jgi:hypothetical protein
VTGGPTYNEMVHLRESSERHEAVLQQLNEERVAALTRISRTLESVIDQLQAIRVRVECASGAVSSADADEYERLRARARQYRWYLDVQREALGLRHHRFLDQFYAAPEPLTKGRREPTTNSERPTSA